MRILVYITVLALISCGSRRVHKDETVSQLTETDVISKLNKTDLTTSIDKIENTQLFTNDFQADSIVVTKEATTYYNPRSKKENLVQEKKTITQYNFDNLTFETLDLKKEFFHSSASKFVERKQVNYFKMILQFWPVLVLAVALYWFWRQKKK